MIRSFGVPRYVLTRALSNTWSHVLTWSNVCNDHMLFPSVFIDLLPVFVRQTRRLTIRVRRAQEQRPRKASTFAHLFVVCCLVTNVSIESVTNACRFHCWHRCVSGAFLPETCRSLSRRSLKRSTRSSLQLSISTAIVLWCTRNPPRSTHFKSKFKNTRS